MPPALQPGDIRRTALPDIRLRAPDRPGRYRVQLIVVDHLGRESAPAVLRLTVVPGPGWWPRFWDRLGRWKR
ncbi:hypothetical protein [Sandaracinobacteroides saxicola]|uniref:Uncharacterized protein n=1 Tax=Sandaracinobacteroides saxicola TaxID=2759707 RepID=A0A7G5II56_9SPHN|nr:hypothetical protein [Sandaracinobacteroides saxicola]QMW23048.1 hypothetical protein H3309_00585 [Sandaracinobacteroides saxicola]